MSGTFEPFEHHYESGEDLALLLLHGTGGNEHDLVGLARAIAPKAALISPRGKVLEQGMPRFFRRLAEGVFDIDDLHARTAELAGWIRGMTQEKEVDHLPLVAIGFSNGANMAGSLLLSEPGLLAGAALLRPMVPFVPEPPPSLEGTPVLISAGTQDQLIQVAETERLEDLLRKCGARVELAWQPGGHGLTRGDLDSIHQWLSGQAWAARA